MATHNAGRTGAAPPIHASLPLIHMWSTGRMDYNQVFFLSLGLEPEALTGFKKGWARYCHTNSPPGQSRSGSETRLAKKKSIPIGLGGGGRRRAGGGGWVVCWWPDRQPPLVVTIARVTFQYSGQLGSDQLMSIEVIIILYRKVLCLNSPSCSSSRAFFST